MSEKINLSKYLAMNGKLENLDLSKTFTSYGDSNKGKAIKSVTLGKFNSNFEQLYLVTFMDNSSHNYADTWIDTTVTFRLDDEFTK